VAISLTILLVEDSPSDALLLTSVADTGDRILDVHTVATLREALTTVADPDLTVDLILLDLHLPDAQGLEAVDRLVTACPDVPIAVLTGSDDNALATGAVSRGAHEFLVKSDLSPERLERLIGQTLVRHEQRRDLARTELALARSREDQRDAEARLYHQQRLDPLTKLPNRAAVVERLDVELERATPADPVVVAVVDIVDFGLLNAAAGPATGDRVLAALAQRLDHDRGDGELVGRIGGDELVLICRPGSGHGVAMERARRLLTLIRQPVHVAGIPRELDARGGIAVVTDPSPGTGGAVLHHAESALTRANQTGADFVLYDDSLRSDAARRLDIEGRLREALRADGLILKYQPIVSLTDGQMVGVEALVRLPDGDATELLPGHFIGIAEENGLIVPLGEWVLEEAGRWASEWAGLRPHEPLWVNVNVSARQLLHDGFVSATNRATSHLGERGLTLELTESTLLDASVEVDERLRQIRQLGNRVAIDDFGTGYASLTYLWRYQIDMLKIDRSFVEAMPNDPAAHDIVTSVVRLGRSMGLTTVAEGVETGEQRDLAAALGCSHAQGYLFAHPLSAEQITELLMQRDPLC
jgi:diguanylate cyclase (GGDEF)-like protein